MPPVPPHPALRPRPPNRRRACTCASAHRATEVPIALARCEKSLARFHPTRPPECRYRRARPPRTARAPDRANAPAFLERTSRSTQLAARSLARVPCCRPPRLARPPLPAAPPRPAGSSPPHHLVPARAPHRKAHPQQAAIRPIRPARVAPQNLPTVPRGRPHRLSTAPACPRALTALASRAPPAIAPPRTRRHHCSPARRARPQAARSNAGKRHPQSPRQHGASAPVQKYRPRWRVGQRRPFPQC